MSKNSQSSNKTASKQPIENAGQIIEAFGGIRPMAAKIDTPVTTVQGWKKRDVIPGARRAQIEKAANDHNIDLSKAMTDTPVKAEPLIATKKKTENKTENKTTKKSNAPKVEVKQTVHPASQSDNKAEHDKLMAAIEAQGRKNMVASTWIATGLILLTAAVGAFIFWPQAEEKLEAQEQKISALEQEFENANEQRPAQQKGFFESIIPEDVQSELQMRADRLQTQVKNVQNTVEQLSEKAEAISSGVLDQNAGPLTERLAVLEEQIGAMQGSEKLTSIVDRIQSLEESFSGQEQLSQSMDQMKNMMITREQAGDTINDTLAKAQEKTGALGETLEGVSGDDLKAAAMLITLSQMRSAFFRQEPFEKDLAVLQRLAGEDDVELQAAISNLAPHANGGVLSSEGLSREFKGLAGDIVVSSLKGEDVSIKERAQARLHNMLQVEKDGALVTGTETQNKVASAQKMLDEGNIQGAIAELQSLDGEAADTAQPFIEQAKASLMAGDLQKLLGDTILSKVTGQLPNGITAIPDMKDLIPTEMPQNIQNSIPGAEQILDAVPMVPNDVIKDEESGVSILPRDSKFKGFSGGSDF